MSDKCQARGIATRMLDVMQPILFGSLQHHNTLIRLFQEGALPITECRVSKVLWRSGLVAKANVGSRVYIVLDSRHPTYPALLTVLAHFASASAVERVTLKPSGKHLIDLRHPLGHKSRYAFRILQHLVNSGGDSKDAIRAHLVDITPKDLSSLLDRLQTECLIDWDSDGVRIAEAVPNSYFALVSELGDVLAKRDKRFAYDAVPIVRKVTGFIVGADGAPPLFGTDARLRNLMAVAKYGPIHLHNLREVTGASKLKVEDVDIAPFGRGSLVADWHTDKGYVVDLHPAHPLRLPLRKLLLKMEQTYRLPTFSHATPPRPTQNVNQWRGDKLALFGGAIATQILLSIGVLGWTFEALCVSLCTGYERVVVKKRLRKLEECGILVGDRKRKPGFNVRVLRIADTFCACAELQELLEIACVAWPSFAKRVHFALGHLPSVTKVQLRRRGLLGHELQSDKPTSWRQLDHERQKRQCIRRYCELTAIMARELSSYEIGWLDGTLYRHIRSSWDSFATFRRDVGLAPVKKNTRNSPSNELRDWCVSRYLHWSAVWGSNPSSDQLVKKDPQLVRCIYVQWGGFPEFYDDIGVSPVGRRRSTKGTTEQTKLHCRHEYHELRKSLGRTPTAQDLQNHTVGLYKRIIRLWGGLPAFRMELGEAQFIDLRRARRNL